MQAHGDPGHAYCGNDLYLRRHLVETRGERRPPLMKVLITGASGFLGGHLAEDCRGQGDTVRVLARKTSDISHLKTIPELEYHYADLREKDALEKACEGVEVVYHCAARVFVSGTYEQHYETNYLGTINVLDACRATGVKRLVNVSSPSTVFDFKDQDDIDESYPYPARYANHYSQTKALAEQEVIKANGTGRLSTTSLRPHAIWGPADKIGILTQIISRLADGRFSSIGHDRDVRVDLCYVKNAAHACMLAGRSEKAGGRKYFITDAEAVSLWPFIDHLCDVLELPRPVKDISPAVAMNVARAVETIWRLPCLKKKGAPPMTRYRVGILTKSSTYNIDAARRDLGYAPVVGVEEGLEQLKSWIAGIGGIEEYVKYVRR
jgi:nucleoside-diphosphate-sugar epimerase